MIDLRGKTALITGAGLGIGRACAEMFASVGADLVLISRSQDNLQQTVQSVRKIGTCSAYHVLDLMVIDGIVGVVQEIKRGGHIDILVNNAGFDRPGVVEKTEMRDFLDVMNIHVTVPFLLTKMFLREMKEIGWGRIINVSSICGLIGIKGGVAYSAAKAGMIGLTKSAAKETAPYGVTVNAVAPGLTRTPAIENGMADKYKQIIINKTPVGRMAEVEEIASVVVFLASNEASYITGAVVPVSGGWGDD